MANDRNFQLQVACTSYETSQHYGYDAESPFVDRRRNYASMDNAIKAAKKEFRRNTYTKITRTHVERDARGLATVFDCYADDGHLIEHGEKYSFVHIDSVRIVDRVTQTVLWES